MSTFCEDDDFVAVRRPKRKIYNEIPLAPSPPTGVAEDPNFLVPQVKKRRVEEKASDVDIVDRSILKNIRVPKKVVETNDYLQRVNLQSKEFVREVQEVISRSLKNKEMTPFEIRTGYLIENRELQRKYTAKRLSLKNDNLKNDSCSDSYGFCFFQEFAAVRDLAKNGMKIGNVKKSLLGAPACGVTLSQHADNLCEQQSQFGWLIICKFLKGRANFVPFDDNPLDPQPGYECHLPQKSSLNGKIRSVADTSQVYLYEYSEDFDLMDHPSHVLPTAAIQIAGISVFKAVTKKVKEGKLGKTPSNRTFGMISPVITPKPPPTPKRLPDDPSGDSGDSKQSSTNTDSVPEPLRVGVSSAGNRHSSGGVVVGTILIKVPLANNLTAEAHVVSLADRLVHLPFGATASSLTLDRFINLEDLYTTIFKDGSVKLSLTSEVLVQGVGFFNYFRVFLRDGCKTKLPMMNFKSYLRTTNRACVLVSHLDCLVILFPDSMMAHDFGLPKPDPLAQPHFLNLVLLSPLSRHRFYSPFIVHKPNELEPSSGALNSIWRSNSASPLVHRFLRFSFAQQGEAQRLNFRRQAEKANPKSASASKFSAPPVFTYKPVTLALDEVKSSSHRPSKASKPVPATAPPPPPPEEEEESVSEMAEVDKDDEDDDIDDLAVLDTIDKVVLDEGSSKTMKEEKPKKESASHLKEVFHDPPASPNSTPKTKKSEKVPVVEHPALCPVRKEAEKSDPKQRMDFQRTLMNSVQDLKTIMTNLKARISTQNNGAEGPAAASPAKATPEDSSIGGATPTPETTPQKNETDNQGVMKSSKDWYWFYMKKQQAKEAEDNENAAASNSTIETPEEQKPTPKPTPKQAPKSLVQPTPTQRAPVLQRDSPQPRVPRVSSFSPRPNDYDSRPSPHPRSDWQQPRPYNRPPLLSRPGLIPRPPVNGPTPSLLSRPGLIPRPPINGPPPGRPALLANPRPPRYPGSSVFPSASPASSNDRRCPVATSSKDVDLREIPTASFEQQSDTFLTSKFDVDMRRPPAHFSRTSVYDPAQRNVLPDRSEPARPTKRISTYEPGRGFQ